MYHTHMYCYSWSIVKHVAAYIVQDILAKYFFSFNHYLISSTLWCHTKSNSLSYCIHPSIHCLQILCRVVGGAASQRHCTKGRTDRGQVSSSSHDQHIYIQLLVNLTCMPLDCGRIPEQPAGTMQTQAEHDKLNTERLSLNPEPFCCEATVFPLLTNL